MYENSTSAITVAEKTADIIATTPLVSEIIIFCGKTRGEMKVLLLVVKMIICIYFMDLTCCLLL